MAELMPYPFAGLLRRMFHELDRKGSIFDLPRRKFFLGSPDHDLGVEFHSQRAASALGPAAGPQSQLAQNVVLSWLGGSRIMELKTVQILDELKIPRPCIDMRNVGYNVEWSQELKLEQSLEEYVKASMLIQILQASGEIPVVAGFADVLYDMSVGYDLKGIRSERVQAFVRGMMDATDSIERLRRQIPAEYRRYRDLPFRTRLSNTLTLSTFHGCPPDEIERIIDFLLREVGLHCVIKLNPMLLGPDSVRQLLNDQLGYTNVHVPDTAFERDTKWEQAVGFVERLSKTAAARGLGLGVKFSNTLIVENTGDFLPASEKEMYLSGAPLHVLAMNLVQRVRDVFGTRIPISFSAGIDRSNFADAVALGLVPVTVCSDLLKPGGYARQATYFTELLRRMDTVGVRNIGDFVLEAHGQAENAGLDAGLAAADVGRARQAVDRRAAVGGEVYQRWVQAAMLRNTRAYVERATSDLRYASQKNSRLPKKVGSRLELFNCLTCDKCIPVCPNDANFALHLPPREVPIQKLRKSNSGWQVIETGSLALDTKHQIANFADFCNECGNCDVFCPEDGGPYVLKPRFFGSLESWRQFSEYDGFYLSQDDGVQQVFGRFDRQEFEVVFDGDHIHYKGAEFDVRFQRSDPATSISGNAAADLDLTWFHIMDAIREGIYESSDINYVNVDVS